jgi:hypothetical protein
MRESLRTGTTWSANVDVGEMEAKDRGAERGSGLANSSIAIDELVPGRYSKQFRCLSVGGIGIASRFGLYQLAVQCGMYCHYYRQ